MCIHSDCACSVICSDMYAVSVYLDAVPKADILHDHLTVTVERFLTKVSVFRNIAEISVSRHNTPIRMSKCLFHVLIVYMQLYV